MIRKCKIKGCKNKYYAKGYCHTHYTFILDYCKKQHIKPYNFKKCKIKSCNIKVYHNKKNGYCFLHYHRWKKYGNAIEPKHTTKGKTNYQWKGGVADYPNHYEMKLVRLKKFKQTKGLCEICKKQATNIHHIDNIKSNHSLKNLMVLCHKCHMRFFHSKPHNTSKFIHLYGMTLKQMTEKYGGSEGCYYSKHKKGILKKFLTFQKASL